MKDSILAAYASLAQEQTPVSNMVSKGALSDAKAAP